MAWLFLSSLCAVECGSASAQPGGPASAVASQRDNALTLEQRGQFAEAERVWQSIAKAEPKSAEAFAHLGLIAARGQRFDEAIAFYIQGYSLEPDFPELQMNLGLALFKAGHIKESIEPFTNELRKHPGDHRLTVLLGMAHYSMGDYLVSIPYLKRAVEALPENLAMRLALARSCLWSRRPICVLDVYRQFVALHQESAEMDMLEGQALDETGDDAAALQQFRSALQTNPKQPYAHFALGFLLWKQGHFGLALPEFLAELASDPRDTAARAYLADCYVQLSDRVKAQEELEKLLARGDLPAMVYRDAGFIYAELGRNQDALENLRKAIALDPENAQARRQLAKLYQSMGRSAEAKEQLVATASTPVQKRGTLFLADLIADAQAP
ncbi:MAG TPA: tetratricopeptide repeat protein [Acidisarcina sp.]